MTHHANKHWSKRVRHRARRHARLALVPHRANQYRPHLVRRFGLVGVAVLVLGMHFMQAVSGGGVLGDQTSLTPQGVLSDTNQARQAHGEVALTSDPRLTEAAQLKAQDMLKQQYWAHTAPDGTPPWKWLGDVQYHYEVAGENLARNFSSPHAVVQAWLASPAHRANILNNKFTNVGIAVVDGMLHGKATSLVVALYGAPAASQVQGAQQFASAPVDTNLSIATRLGMAIQSLTPAAVGSVVVLLFAGGVALVAHHYRRRLPKALRSSWYHHHGLYKAAGLTACAVLVVVLYSGGQL